MRSTLPQDRPQAGSPTVRPGALTALLGELARAPEASGWKLPATPGETFGRFEIVREIGRGGFGVVYEAKDSELGRCVAFKAVRVGSSDAAREQLALAEAEAAARLAHPNIVHLYDVGRCDRGAFLIMELLHGESLEERLERGPPLTLREAAHVATEIARGLAHAHEQGVVHRDLKPGNVFLCDDGQVKVLDFGLAHVFGRRSRSGGTPAYMAPEQARGEPSDERADVYALGVILHELVTGRRPLDSGAHGAGASGRQPDLPGAPARLAKLVARMHASNPADRPASAGDARDELAAIRDALAPRRALWVAASIATAAVVGAGLFAWSWQRPLPPGRLLAAIADTENASGERDLDGVSELLRTALESSPRLSIVARSRLVNVLREAGPLPRSIDALGARRAALAAGVRILIVPAVRRTDVEYQVAARIVDLAAGGTTYTARETTVTPAGLREAVERLSTNIRRALHEDANPGPAASPSLLQSAPAVPAAWARYAEGQRLESEGRPEEARDAYLASVALDPDFPLPRLSLVGLPGWQSTPVESWEQHLEALKRNFDRLPPKDRLYAEAELYGAEGEGDFEEGVARFQRAADRWPEDPRPYRALIRMARFYRADLARIRPWIEKAIEIAPLAEAELIGFLVLLDRLDDALLHATRETEVSPSGDSFRRLSRVHLLRGEREAALEAARRSVSLGGAPWLRAFVEGGAIDEVDALVRRDRDLRWVWLAMRGRWREARASLPPAPRISGGLPISAPARDLMLPPPRALVALWRGVPADIRREVRAQLEGGYAFASCNAWPLAALGDLDTAERLTSLFYPLGSRFTCLRMFGAVHAWKRGDPAAALRGLAEIHLATADLHRGEILSELGRDPEAVEAFESFRRGAKSGALDEWVWLWGYPRALHLQACALARLGKRSEAQALNDRLLHLWSHADLDHPLLREAQALRERLAIGRPP
jgi:tetratricopeptide (TPR) repeat protein